MESDAQGQCGRPLARASSWSLFALNAVVSGPSPVGPLGAGGLSPGLSDTNNAGKKREDRTANYSRSFERLVIA